MRLLHGSIRRRVSLLVFIPILSLAGIYAYAVGTTVGDALRLARATTVNVKLRQPNTDLQQALDLEGTYALFYVAVPNRSNLSQLSQCEVATNDAVRTWRYVTTSPVVTSGMASRERRAIAVLTAGLDRLAAVRSAIAHKKITLLSALNYYNSLEINGFNVYDGWIEQATSVPLVSDGLYLTKLGEAEQAAVDENDLLLATHGPGSFTAADRTEFTSLAATRRFLIAQNAPELSAPFSGYYAKDVSPSTSAALTSLEDKVISGRPVHGWPPIQTGYWYRTAIPYINDLAAMLQKSGNVVAAEALAQAHATYRDLLLIGGLGLLAIVASAAVSAAVGRRIVRQLDDLRASAVDVAHHQLPSVIRALRADRAVELPSGGPPAAAHGHEIAQVWQAFRLLQQAAIDAATEEARLRRGVNAMFLSLARRSQSLLHRQLGLLDRLEREAEQPEELDKLFRIDHLTTRMRRHAESLIVLSGDVPGRGWEHPVPLDDVLRAAVAEVEDYARIRVLVRTKAALAGSAVADVIHLVAELAENATVFSPPNTPVRILGDVAGRGFAIEIEDRGVGVTPEQLAAINRDLADPPEFEPSEGDHLGLLIVGKLAQRHAIRVTVRDSPFGGTDAIVFIPGELVIDAGSAASHGQISDDGEPRARLTGRHSAPTSDGPGKSLVAVDVLPRLPTSAMSAVATVAPVVEDPPLPAVDEDGHMLGLPTRVPRASLAPQLRDQPDSSLVASDAATTWLAAPEDEQRAMTDLQHGWQRGWSADIDADEFDDATSDS
jgi:signal transduction histidine kinase